MSFAWLSTKKEEKRNLLGLMFAAILVVVAKFRKEKNM